MFCRFILIHFWVDTLCTVAAVADILYLWSANVNGVCFIQSTPAALLAVGVLCLDLNENPTLEDFISPTAFELARYVSRSSKLNLQLKTSEVVSHCNQDGKR